MGKTQLRTDVQKMMFEDRGKRASAEQARRLPQSRREPAYIPDPPRKIQRPPAKYDNASALAKYGLIAVLFLSSCVPTYTIGESEADFLAHNNVRIERQSTDESVYRKNLTNQTLFYYFDNGILTRVDHGVRLPDVNIGYQNLTPHP